jgi:hypothetical protein
LGSQHFGKSKLFEIVAAGNVGMPQGNGGIREIEKSRLVKWTDFQN